MTTPEPEPEYDGGEAFQIARLITSGIAGLELTKVLLDRFPAARRTEVFLAVGTAVAAMQLDISLAEMELELLRRGHRLDGEPPSYRTRLTDSLRASNG